MQSLEFHWVTYISDPEHNFGRKVAYQTTNFHEKEEKDKSLITYIP